MRPTIVIDAPEGDWGFSAPSNIDSDQSFFSLTGFVAEEEDEDEEEDKDKEEDEEEEEPIGWLCLKKLMAFIGLG